jgi:hypothetical protein
MGLGGFPTVTLAEARKAADRWRNVAAAGRDPVKEREAEERAARREDISLAVLTADAFEARKAELKGDGVAGRWLSPRTIHVLPKLGKVPVTDLDQRDIRDTLAPLWHAKADTARKALNRLSLVLKHAAALGIEVDLQATDKARALLGRCCITLVAKDSHRESKRLDRWHEQAITRPLPHDELVQLHRLTEEAWVFADLA